MLKVSQTVCKNGRLIDKHYERKTNTKITWEVLEYSGMKSTSSFINHKWYTKFYKLFDNFFYFQVLEQIEMTTGINPYEHTVCHLCGGGDNEDQILLCDGCDEGYALKQNIYKLYVQFSYVLLESCRNEDPFWDMDVPGVFECYAGHWKGRSR